MKKNLWIFGTLFLILSAFLVFKELNRISYEGDEAKTKAYIVNKSICYSYGGRVYRQCVNYVFVSGGKIYKGTKKIKEEQYQYIGNTLTVRYSIKNPQKNEVVGFNNEFYEKKERVFISLKKEGGYSQIELINGIYFFKDYIGDDILEEEGLYIEKSDTLILNPFTNDFVKKYLFNQDKELINIETGIIYK